MESSQQLLKQLNEVIEISQSGAVAISYQPFNIYNMVNEVIDLMKAGIELKRLKLIVNCPNATITNDRFRIQKILLNLLGNAIKFTKNGYIKIDIKLKPNLTIAIEDTGIGIPADKLHIIFDKFYKITPSYKSGTYNGAGMGLYIAREFAHQLEGDIKVISELGKGSIFIFELI